MKKIVTFILMSLLLSLACASNSQVVRVDRPVVTLQNWIVVTSIPALKQQLIFHPKAVVMFSTDWCGPCKYVESFWEGRERIGEITFIELKIFPGITDSDLFFEQDGYDRYLKFMTQTMRPQGQRGRDGFPMCSVVGGPFTGSSQLRDYVKVQFSGADNCTTTLLQYLKPRVRVVWHNVDNRADFWQHVATSRNALILFGTKNNDRVSQNLYQGIIDFWSARQTSPDFVVVNYQVDSGSETLVPFVEFTHKFDRSGDDGRLLPICVAMTNIRPQSKISDLVQFTGSQLEDCTVGLYNWLRANEYR